MKPLRKQGIILFTVLALVLVACGGAAEETVEETTPEVVESLESPAVTTTSTVDTGVGVTACLLYTSPSPRDQRGSRMPSSA